MLRFRRLENGNASSQTTKAVTLGGYRLRNSLFSFSLLLLGLVSFSAIAFAPDLSQGQEQSIPAAGLKTVSPSDLAPLVPSSQPAEPVPADLPADNQPAAPVAKPAVKKSPGYRTVTMVVTAYCSCPLCCQEWSKFGRTASGKPITANGGHFVAGDRNLKFGTKVSIPGYHAGRPVPVLDRGGDVVGRRLDVFLPSHEEALRWGRKTLPVRIYEP